MFFLDLLLSASAVAAPVKLDGVLGALDARVAGLDPSSCAAELDAAFEGLRRLDRSNVDVEHARAAHRELADAAWATRQRLQRVLRELHQGGPIDEACVTGLRRVDIALRYLVDELSIEAGDEASPWLVTEGFTGLDDLRSGDILVTRGAALSSAGIAHIGRVDSQFSHNAMVHIDAEGRRWTVEAYLERGGLVQPLDDFLDHGLGRIVVARYEDPELAAKAAALAHARIAGGEPIDYDARFDSDDDGERLYCSEIGPWAFALAGGPSDVPLHKTVFPHDRNPAMFELMGIDTPLLAAPADLLFDPRFQLVGEWRALDEVETMRRHDAVVEALFRWMEEEGYRLDPRWKHRATVNVGLAVRRTPGLARLVESMVHPNGDPTFLVAGLALQDAGERVWRELQQDLRGVPHPSYAELHAALERLRQRDLERWQRRPRRAKLHRVLRPER